ncbi:hypothetical protein LS68_009270 [Helicobacter sp. MIT 05-5293]|uniref:hypothetical protein n=1 Tax=unclassified Helicobacter TaxID=2593540 RepID=UPI00051CD90D|nr:MULTISPECIES: hypothetical protein [unclassified Helicobacter]TLD79850.1 hypothetical protein LS68_009270 [Helicobacter sp. MIT 05-5293]TLD85523.1 hypothetical protein LS69_009020 [Helicobacter sp. MIT 05-5294]
MLKDFLSLPQEIKELKKEILSLRAQVAELTRSKPTKKICQNSSAQEEVILCRRDEKGRFCKVHTK